jgi:hypothetical protein
MNTTIVELFSTVATLTGAVGGLVGFIVFFFTRSTAQTSSAATAWTAASFPAAVLIAIVITVKAPPDPEQGATVAALSIERRDAHER